MNRSLIVLVLVVAAAAFLLPRFILDDGDVTQVGYPAGAELYLDNCAVCHGRYGEGDGAISPDLAVSLKDLRYISARNGDVFPREEVRAIIDGRAHRAEHGPPDMPVWGAVFAARDPEAGQAENQVAAVVEFLESVQLRNDATGS